MNRNLTPLCFLALLLTTVLLTPVSDAHADVRLPGFFGDQMVLQQQMKIKVWGWADAGESVTVSVGDQSATTKGDDDGKWSVELPAQQASKKPTNIVVKGNNTIEINDVLIGEVWLCSGQGSLKEAPMRRWKSNQLTIHSFDTSNSVINLP